MSDRSPPQERSAVNRRLSPFLMRFAQMVFAPEKHETGGTKVRRETTDDW